MQENNTVSLEQQHKQGLRPQRNNYITRGADPISKVTPTLPIQTEIVHTINAQPLATQHVEVKTSAVDRAKGFLLASIPLYLAFATAVVGVIVLGFRVPLASLATLTIFLLAFVAAWVVGYGYTLTVSAEGVNLYEAKNKWDVIRTEQTQRWAHWEKLVRDHHDH